MFTVQLCRTDGGERILQATCEVNITLTGGQCCYLLDCSIYLYQMVNYCLDSLLVFAASHRCIFA